MTIFCFLLFCLLILFCRYDVAVLRLERPVYYEPHIAPICLPRAGLDPEVRVEKPAIKINFTPKYYRIKVFFFPFLYAIPKTFDFTTKL